MSLFLNTLLLHDTRQHCTEYFKYQQNNDQWSHPQQLRVFCSSSSPKLGCVFRGWLVFCSYLADGGRVMFGFALCLERWWWDSDVGVVLR